MKAAGIWCVTRTLVAAEEEQPVANDWAAQRAAELVAAEPVVDALAVCPHGREVLRRVEALVPEELEPIAAEFVRARLRDRIHRRRRVHAVLGGQSARRDAELLHRVGERERQIEVVVRIVVHRAVQDICDAGAESTGDRYGHGIGSLPLAADVGRVHGGARQDDEVSHLPALQRKLHDALVLDDFSNTRALHIDQRRRGLDGDRLLQRADTEHHVDDGSSRRPARRSRSARRSENPGARPRGDRGPSADSS